MKIGVCLLRLIERPWGRARSATAARGGTDSISSGGGDTQRSHWHCGVNPCQQRVNCPCLAVCHFTPPGKFRRAALLKIPWGSQSGTMGILGVSVKQDRFFRIYRLFLLRSTVAGRSSRLKAIHVPRSSGSRITSARGGPGGAERVLFCIDSCPHFWQF